MLALLLVLVIDHTPLDSPSFGCSKEVTSVVTVEASPLPLVEVATFRINTIAKAQTIYALPKGPRTIQRIEWQAHADSAEWRLARLRLVLDQASNSKPVVDLPLQQFFHSEPRRVPSGSNPSSSSSTWINLEPWPYQVGGRLILDTKGPIQGTFRVLSVPEKTRSEETTGGVQDRPMEVVESRKSAMGAKPPMILPVAPAFGSWSRDDPWPNFEAPNEAGVGQDHADPLAVD